MTHKKEFHYHYKWNGVGWYYHVENYGGLYGIDAKSNRLQELQCSGLDQLRSFVKKVCNPQTAVIFGSGGFSIQAPGVKTFLPFQFFGATHTHSLTGGTFYEKWWDGEYIHSSGLFSKLLAQVFKKIDFKPDNLVLVQDGYYYGGEKLAEFFLESDDRYRDIPEIFYGADVFSLLKCDESKAKSFIEKLCKPKTVVLFDMKSKNIEWKVAQVMGENATAYDSKNLSSHEVINLMERHPEADRFLLVTDKPYNYYGNLKAAFENAFTSDDLFHQKPFYSVNCEGILE